MRHSIGLTSNPLKSPSWTLAIDVRRTRLPSSAPVLYFPCLCVCVVQKKLVRPDYRKLRGNAGKKPSYQERKRVLTEDADCIIALPGGPGTWDELWEIVCLKGIGKWSGRLDHWRLLSAKESVVLAMGMSYSLLNTEACVAFSPCNRW